MRMIKTKVAKNTPWTFSDVRYLTYLIKTKTKKSSSHAKIINSDLSWQERAAWNERVLNYEGKKGENIDWLTISNNSREIAQQKLTEKSKRVSGSNNPGFQHGGRMSPFSKKSSFYDPTLNTRVMDNHKKNKTLPIYKEYWISRGFTEEESIQKVREQQTQFSLEKCIKKHGQEAGTKIWNDRQEKWLKSYKKTNFSKISQVLFNELMTKLSNTGNIYYATHDRSDMKDYINKEYTLKLKDISIKPDFICLDRKRIIEFDGDYWHRDNIANPTREFKRQAALEDFGFSVFRVKECVFKSNKQKVIEECIRFLENS